MSAAREAKARRACRRAIAQGRPPGVCQSRCAAEAEA